MPDAIQTLIPALPPGYGGSQEFVYPIDLGPSIVRRILITWPAGCGGLVFIRIGAGGGYAFPSVAGGLLAFDDYTYVIDVTNQTNNGNWSVVAQNRDYIEHDPIIVFEYDYLRGTVNSASYTPIPL